MVTEELTSSVRPEPLEPKLKLALHHLRPALYDGNGI
jgi:hypothetical protein